MVTTKMFQWVGEVGEGDRAAENLNHKDWSWNGSITERIQSLVWWYLPMLADGDCTSRGEDLIM